MSKTVGIPRCLLYYNYFPGWQAFFQELGGEVVLSPMTNKQILDLGVKQAVDEICLPVKLFFGHVENLKAKVDYLFIPRMMSVERHEWICPKFLGLPDMVKALITDLPPLIAPDFNLHKSRLAIYSVAKKAALPFTENRFKIIKALVKGLVAQRKYQRELLTGQTPPEVLEKVKYPNPGSQPLKIVLLGHPYLIYDSFINLNLLKKLSNLGASLITPEMLSATLIKRGAKKQAKDLFWTLNKITLGVANHFFSAGGIDGIVQLASFGCGPDALINELIERKAHRLGEIPLLSINIDEHTGEAGMVTRLEAFVDMIRWRRRK